jgi:hypothetical protein
MTNKMLYSYHDIKNGEGHRRVQTLVAEGVQKYLNYKTYFFFLFRHE